MHAGQSTRDLRLSSVSEEWAHSFDRSNSHLCRAASGKKTEHHLFPQAGIGSLVPDGFKFRQPKSDLGSPLLMSFKDPVDRKRFFYFFHGLTDSISVMIRCQRISILIMGV